MKPGAISQLDAAKAARQAAERGPVRAERLPDRQRHPAAALVAAGERQKGERRDEHGAEERGGHHRGEEPRAGRGPRDTPRRRTVEPAHGGVRRILAGGGQLSVSGAYGLQVLVFGASDLLQEVHLFRWEMVLSLPRSSPAAWRGGEASWDEVMSAGEALEADLSGLRS